MYAPTLVSGRGMEKKRGGREGEKERLGEASGRPLGGPEGREREGESGSVTGSSKGRVSFQIVIHHTAHVLRASKTAPAWLAVKNVLSSVILQEALPVLLKRETFVRL